MWLIIIIVAYFFTALANLVDKILLGRYIGKPIVYAFFIGAMSTFVALLIPFGFSWPGADIIILGLLAGATFILALYFLFNALLIGEASKIIPLVGGISPIFVFIFSWLALGIFFTGRESLAFIFLLAGIYFVSRQSFRKSSHTKNDLFFSLAAAIVFAAYYTIAKYIYLHSSFLNGFIAMAFGTSLSAFALLIWPNHRRAIGSNFQKRSTPASAIFFFGQGAGAVGAFLTSYAISLANVAIINALQGLQFAFLLIMVIVLSRFYPHLLEEKMTKKIILEKVLAIVLIGIGLLQLAGI